MNISVEMRAGVVRLGGPPGQKVISEGGMLHE
jgi:hypothetical protein